MRVGLDHWKVRYFWCLNSCLQHWVGLVASKYLGCVFSFWAKAQVIVLIMFLGSFASAQVSTSLEFGAGLRNTYWSVQGSVFECLFSQKIPDYGEAAFYHRAGEDIQFRLWSDRNLFDYSEASISLLPPPWRPAEKSEYLGTSPIKKGSPLLNLDSRRSNIFFHGLLEGRRPTITHHTSYDENRFIKLFVSSTGFEKYYPVYMSCVRQLLPMNFDQVKRLKVLFGSGEDKIDKADQAVLDRIIFYILNDPRVNAIYLDGHSDNVGRRYDNRQISLRRVNDVKRYLIEEGIQESLITSRFHGGRYPVENNKTAKGRSENRRVTIRLEMDEDMPIPEHLLFKPLSVE